MAARGTCNMDDGEKAIEDETLVAKLRAVARRIHRRAIITATVATLVALAFPG
jgi:hypothetical protein